MSNALEQLPNPSDFGTTFNYAAWTPNTEITLCNVPWNSDYRDVVYYPTYAALDTYLNANSGPNYIISKLTICKPGEPVRINLPFNVCYKFNYLRVKNPTQPISATYTDPTNTTHVVNDQQREFYYFITNIRYLAPNTTELVLELDVWQTFSREVTFGNCYIEQGHIGIANENQLDNNGRDYLTVPEGLDVGNEYIVYSRYTEPIAYDGNTSTGGYVVVTLSADIFSDPGTAENPNLNTSKGTQPEGLPQGVTVVVFKSIDDYAFFIQDYAQYPWITQTIISVTVVPAFDETFLSSTSISGMYTINLASIPAYNISFTPGNPYMPSNYPKMTYLEGRYNKLNKFNVFPYSFYEITTYSGQPLILKPELMPDNDMTMRVYTHASPPSPKVAIFPINYNAAQFTVGQKGKGEYLDIATYIDDLPQFSVANNQYLNYIASNKNSIAFSYQNADWSQQKAIQGAQTAYNNVTASMGQVASQSANEVSYNNATARNSNIGQGIHAATNFLTNPSLSNLAGQGLGAVTDISVRNAQISQANNLVQMNANAELKAGYNIGENNQKYANYAAQGDYQNEIARINAKLQDAKLMQPSVAGQVGGSAFILSNYSNIYKDTTSGDGVSNYGWFVAFNVKTITPGIMATIGEYWLRYGYAINRFGRMPNDFKCMSKFTYWKLKETYISSSSCPEMFKQTLRGIFEKGITVWTNASDIGNIDIADNVPVAGITL